MATGAEPSSLESLKAAANSLFAQKKYGEAALKYTQALAVEEDAVTFSNRAACRLGMAKYADALTDARDAVRLDPNYAKGLARAAMASEGVGLREIAVQYWERALEALPKKNMSAAQQRQKDLYQKNLQENERFLDASKKDPRLVFKGMMTSPSSRRVKAPWEIAEAFRPELEANNNRFSSAWVILGAYKEYSAALEIMKQLKTVKKAELAELKDQGYIVANLPEAMDPDDDNELVGKPGAMAHLTNAMLRDRRVYHLMMKEFYQSYGLQQFLESTTTNAWTSGTAEDMMAEAKKDLPVEGWDKIRPALEVTVYQIIMHAGLESLLKQRNDNAVQFCERAVGLVKLGREEWKDVPPEVRGPIFDDPFYNALRAMYVDVYNLAFNADESLFPLDHLIEELDDFLHDIEDVPPPAEGLDPGYVLSYYVYPKALATTLKANGLSIKAGTPSIRKNTLVAQQHYREGAKLMLAAADMYPKDEDQHILNLKVALTLLYYTRAPLSQTMPIMERIRAVHPGLIQLWPRSFTDPRRDDLIANAFKAENEARAGLASGKLTMDSVFIPPGPKKPTGKANNSSKAKT